MMKKLIMPLIVALCSCTSEHSEIQTQEDAKIVKISSIEMNEDDINSRWVYDENNRFGWNSNDVLGIFPMDAKTKVGKGSQLEFPVALEEGKTVETVSFDGGGWAFKGGYTYSAYSPYNLLSTKGNKIKFSYANQSRRMIGTSYDVRESMFKIAPPSTVENGFVLFRFSNVETFLRIILKGRSDTIEKGLPTGKKYKSLTLIATEGDVIPLEKEYDIFSMELDETDKIKTLNDKDLSYGNSLIIDLMEATLDEKGEMLVWLAIPAIGTKYGSFKVLVMDTEGNEYLCENPLFSGDSTPFQKSLNRNARVGMLLNSFEETEGFHGSIEGWKTEFEMTGTAK